MIYDVYHDESKEKSFWHVFLFIPRSFREKIFDFLDEAKKLSKYNKERIGLKFVNSKSSFECAESWLTILNSALQQKSKGSLAQFTIGKSRRSNDMLRKHPILRQFDNPPCCKIGVFHIKDNHKFMTGHIDGLSEIETTFRMGLQGAAHYCFSREQQLVIGDIFLDGDEHFRIEYERDFDAQKVLSRLDERLRDYCQLHDTSRIRSNDVDATDRAFLDLADLYLGVFRRGTLSATGRLKNEKRREYTRLLCNIISPLIIRSGEGEARMRNSRFYRFGTFSSAWIDNGNWKFESLAPKFRMPSQDDDLSLALV